MNSFKSISKSVRGDWLPRIDFVVDYPVREVWPLIVRWDLWVHDKPVTHVSGEADQLGTIKKVSFMKDGKEVSCFLFQIVRLIQDVRLVSRVLPLPAPIDGFESFRGYTIFNLFNLGEGKTLVSYETVCDCESTLLSEEEAEAVIGTQADADTVNHWHAHYIPELKRLLAEARSTK